MSSPYVKAERLLMSGAWGKAQRILDSIDSAEEGSEAAFILSGCIAYARLQPLRALNTFSQARTVSSQNLGISFYVGLCYDMLGNRQEALDQMDRLLYSAAPLSLIVHAAEFVYRHGVNLKGVYGRHLEKVLRPLLQERSWDRAEKEVLRADVLRLYGDGPGSFRILSSLHKRYPLSVPILRSYAKTLYNLGDFPGQLVLLEKIQELVPHDLSGLSELSESSFRCGQFSNACRYLHRLVMHVKTNGRYFFNHGICLLSAGHKATALISFRKAACLLPYAADVHYNQGSLAHQLGFLEEAVESYRRTLRIRPSHQASRKNLSLAYAQKKNYQGAFYVLQGGRPSKQFRASFRQLTHVMWAHKLVESSIESQNPSMFGLGLGLVVAGLLLAFVYASVLLAMELPL